MVLMGLFLIVSRSRNKVRLYSSGRKKGKGSRDPPGGSSAISLERLTASHTWEQSFSHFQCGQDSPEDECQKRLRKDFFFHFLQLFFFFFKNIIIINRHLKLWSANSVHHSYHCSEWQDVAAAFGRLFFSTLKTTAKRSKCVPKLQSSFSGTLCLFGSCIHWGKKEKIILLM